MFDIDSILFCFGLLVAFLAVFVLGMNVGLELPAWIGN